MTTFLKPNALDLQLPGNPDHVASGADRQKPDAAAIRGWLLHYLEKLLKLPAAQIATGDPLAEYGLDSSGAVGLAADVGIWLRLELDADLVYSHPSVDALTAHLAAEVART